MGKKKGVKVRVTFVGENSCGVTGSCTLVEYGNRKVLLECGLYQSNSLKNDYEINTRKFKFKAKDIDYVFLNHAHIDHSGLLPRLYKEGCKAQIIATEKTIGFLPALLKDSAFIMQRDCETLSRNKNVSVLPIYGNEDVSTTLDMLRGYKFNELYTLDETFSFMFVPAGHIVGSAQLVLYVKEASGHVQKILYTSDLGNIKLKKPYVEPFEKVTKANIVIAETTYGASDREIGKKDRQNDLNKIKSVILDTCLYKRGKVLIPSFALDRSQFLLTVLYDMFGKDESFDVPIVVDSPLACKMFKVYEDNLDEENKAKFLEVCNWKNVKFISNADESKLCVSDGRPKVILSSSGMLTAGRSVYYSKALLPDQNSTILFCGFASANSLAYKIKNGDKQKTISIDKKAYANKCSIVDLKSFSSHIQREDMLMYYKQINCSAIYLVHGDMDAKLEFAKDLKEELTKGCSTTKVCVVNKGTSITL